jgi:hypothetical protein
MRGQTSKMNIYMKRQVNMNLFRELRLLSNEVDMYGVEPEHVDRLIRIAEEIQNTHETDELFARNLEDFRTYFERWGVCTDKFNVFFGVCIMYAEEVPQEAVVEEAKDLGEEVSSPGCV